MYILVQLQGSSGAMRDRRLETAKALREAELAALGATRQSALRLLVEIGLGGEEDDEGESLKHFFVASG